MLTVSNTDKFEFFSSPANLILNDPMCDFHLKVVMTETLSGRAYYMPKSVISFYC